MELILANHGSYPRIGDTAEEQLLRRTIAQREKGEKTEADLVDVKNLGEKTIDEIKAALAGLGLSLGMRIDPNVLGALGRGATTK